MEGIARGEAVFIRCLSLIENLCGKSLGKGRDLCVVFMGSEQTYGKTDRTPTWQVLQVCRGAVSDIGNGERL